MSGESVTPYSHYYYHGGYGGLNVGDYVLPPDETGATSSRDFVPEGMKNPIRTDRVYITDDLDAAIIFAKLSPYRCVDVYRVIPDYPIETDPDYDGTGSEFGSWQTPRARVVERLFADNKLNPEATQ